MDETYRMLGRHHDAELEREAARRRLAAQLPRSERRRRRFALTVPLSAFRRLLRDRSATPAAPVLEARRR